MGGIYGTNQTRQNLNNQNIRVTELEVYVFLNILWHLFSLGCFFLSFFLNVESTQEKILSVEIYFCWNLHVFQSSFQLPI